MQFFPDRDGVMHAEDVNLIDLANEVGTPFYCYASGALEASYRSFTDALKDLLGALGDRLEAESPLGPVTYWRIGGPALALVQPSTEPYTVELTESC